MSLEHSSVTTGTVNCGACADGLSPARQKSSVKDRRNKQQYTAAPPWPVRSEGSGDTGALHIKPTRPRAHWLDETYCAHVLRDPTCELRVDRDLSEIPTRKDQVWPCSVLDASWRHTLLHAQCVDLNLLQPSSFAKYLLGTFCIPHGEGHR